MSGLVMSTRDSHPYAMTNRTLFHTFLILIKLFKYLFFHVIPRGQCLLCVPVREALLVKTVQFSVRRVSASSERTHLTTACRWENTCWHRYYFIEIILFRFGNNQLVVTLTDTLKVRPNNPSRA